MADMEARLSALEAWKVEQQAWAEKTERQNESRHTDNVSRFLRHAEGIAEIKKQLNVQDAASIKRDKKLDKIDEKTTTILLRIAGDDGEQRALDKQATENLATANLRTASVANRLTALSWIVGPLMGATVSAVVYWLWHH